VLDEQVFCFVKTGVVVRCDARLDEGCEIGVSYRSQTSGQHTMLRFRRSRRNNIRHHDNTGVREVFKCNNLHLGTAFTMLADLCEREI
jgi:hypothetical protein